MTAAAPTGAVGGADVHLALLDPAAALATAEVAERCLALVYEQLGRYHAERAATNQSRRSVHKEEAEVWYRKAASVWSKWRDKNLGVPYSTKRLQAVQTQLTSVLSL